MNSCQGWSPPAPAAQASGSARCRASVYLHRRPGWAQPLGHPAPHKAPLLLGGEIPTAWKGIGVRVRPRTAPVPRGEPFPRKIPSPHTWGQVFSCESWRSCSGPAAGQHFPAAGNRRRENRLLPTPARAASHPPSWGEAQARRDPSGIAAPRLCSPEGRGDQCRCPWGYGCPNGTLQPCHLALESPGLGSEPPRGDDRCPLPGTERPSAWLQIWGSHSPTVGTCRAAPSTLLALQAPTLLHPLREQFWACAAPVDTSPGPQGPGWVLGCTGRWKTPLGRPQAGWPGCKAGLACTRQGLNSALPQGMGEPTTREAVLPEGMREAVGKLRAGKAEPRDRAGAPGPAPTRWADGMWQHLRAGDALVHWQQQEILPPPQFPSPAGERWP